MRVPIPDPAHVQPSELKIIRLEFALERSKMKQEHLKLQGIADKAENNAQAYEHKA